MVAATPLAEEPPNAVCAVTAPNAGIACLWSSFAGAVPEPLVAASPMACVEATLADRDGVPWVWSLRAIVDADPLPLVSP